VERGIRHIEVSRLQISPLQPRKSIDEGSIAELAASIRKKGVLQPLLVRPLLEGFEIVAGERRFRAAIKAGLEFVPAIVKNLGDQETLEIAIVENLQREDLNPVEEARAFQALMGFGLKQSGVAQTVGRSRSAVANSLRLLQLPELGLEALEAGGITPGHARAILALDEKDREWALNEILTEGLSVREAEKLKVSSRRSSRQTSDGRYQGLSEELSRFAGTRVRILGGSRGKIEFHFHSEDELQRLLELFGYSA